MTKTKMVSMPDSLHRQLREYEEIHPDFNFSRFVRECMMDLLNNPAKHHLELSYDEMNVLHQLITVVIEDELWHGADEEFQSTCMLLIDKIKTPLKTQPKYKQLFKQEKDV